MGRKTADPHPESFLAFGAWVAEQRAAIEEALPAVAAPDALRRIMGADYEALPGWQRRDHCRRHEEWTAVRKEWASLLLLDAGVTRAALDAPNASLAFVVDVIGNFFSQARGASPLEAMRQRAARAPGSEAWHPRRRTVVDVIAAVHVTDGELQAQRTADILNKGIPRAHRKGDPVTRSNVRDAVERAARRIHAAFVHPATLEVLARDTRAQMLGIAALWKEASERPAFRKAHLPMAGRAHCLFREGALVDIFDAAASPPPLAGEIDAIQGRMLRLALAPLEREAGRRQRLAA